jgi:protein associated with RNAse G/E
MLVKIMRDRLDSLNSLDKDIDVVLQEFKLGAVDKDEQDDHLRFEGMSKDLQSYLREYKEELERYLEENPALSFDDYQKSFAQKDNKLNSLLQGYMFFRSKLA